MGNGLHSNTSDLAFQNATEFLQTVVVIDDKPYFDRVSDEVGKESMSAAGQETENAANDIHPNLQKPVGDKPSSMADPEELDVKTLIDEFANKGIACAVLWPYSVDDGFSQATKLTEVADIVVLDWIINNDNGRTAKELIQGMLEGDGNTDRTRLIAVYTGQPGLTGVPESCAQVLTEYFGTEPESLCDFTFQSGAVRLAIFGKERTRFSPLDEEVAKRIVATSELPQRLIREFASMTNGLLPNLAIAGLSEIRSQTHRLLKQFSRDLDPAYLGHRLLIRSPQDAEDHALAMLVAEILSVLESTDVTKYVGTNAICARIEEISLAGDLRFEHLPIDGADDIPFLVENGVTHKDFSFGGWKWAKVTHAFAQNEMADDSNRQFAHLMNVKTRYGERDPCLTLGSILHSKQDENDSYWICMQPKCDAVRITEAKPFPLIPLKRVSDHSKDFTIVVKHQNSWVLLEVPQNPFHIKMFEFQPTDHVRQLVTTERCGNMPMFKSVDGQVFEWIDELKDEHSQRIANDFAASFARVGLSESEWVRRSGKKGK